MSLNLNAMKNRKTIEIETILAYGNRQLARVDEYADAKFKAGVCTMIEEVLFRANRYRGFHFVSDDSGEEVGVGHPLYYNRFYH